ncbi:pyridoxamine 5'-phosphate oxidase family protein [Rhizorhapis sp.]|uniref:pyridoxamine 5'-phosphate oxidase family protein n=1 Tax=Rhizorhapis sp. TaxID=1968842 RepID=UPI002B4785FA|nr:pyridoxamine 5'-phosphate oxidase family protein [Rhizorhapis sp.]HKR18124.1 pyridoxamine 5'-phosphate oxidase family protein [Rhizorhapis sp.]
MAEFADALTADHCAFIERQPMFFVATAAQGSRINLSPKGYDSFRILGPDRVAYLDLGGSGNETQAHLTADGRITLMFCAFDRPPLILRIYGQGKAVLPQDSVFAELYSQFPSLPGVRQVFDIAVQSVQTSCGWGVPEMALKGERDTLAKYHAQQDPQERLAKISSRTRSIDGLPLRVQSTIPAGQWPTEDA